MPTLFRRTIHGEYTEYTDNIATDSHGVGLVMTSLEDTVLADAVEFTAVGGAVLEFCSADAFPAVQVFMLTPMACNPRRESRLMAKSK